jgi:hypothetical protein
MKKQSQQDCEKRLADLRCPVHGTDLSQIDEGHMQCPRRDCRIRFDYGESGIVAHMTDGLLAVQRPDVVLM